ncbi:MAG TPA: ACP S-malonyltransferase, partial [Myxococcales bacterium]|nr:ACP S-malonyltransferase [Myxococcales bacterium]
MKLAFVFPGQGSQSVGMGQALAQAYPAARGALDEADAALGGGLLRLMADGPEEELRKTANTQPAILAVSTAVHRVLVKEAGGKFRFPAFYAGHSLGEYSALVAASALSLQEAVRAVRARGAFMQEAVPAGEGAMAAILGLEPPRVKEACEEARAQEPGKVVEPANYNSPEQTVIAGHASSVDRAIAICKAKGAKRALPLPVSAPFHCSLMAPVQPRLSEVLGGVQIRRPTSPVIANATAQPN